MKVHGVNDVWQTEMHAAETLAPAPKLLEVKIAIEKTKRQKLTDIDQIPTDQKFKQKVKL
jgi:hypothetical protein